MNPRAVFLLLLVFSLPGFAYSPSSPEWGFYGHRRLNRLAVFTLPAGLAAFFKPHIEYVTEHAVDPDKRRYATRHEAVRHYIDIDHWGTYPFPEVPRAWPDALGRYSDFFALTEAGDTIKIWSYQDAAWTEDSLFFSAALLTPEIETRGLSKSTLRSLVIRQLLPQYYEDEWRVHPDSFRAITGVPLPGEAVDVKAVDHFSGYGIIPYHLLHMQNRLTEAFRAKQVNRVLRLSAEMGHYIGDAHVPLHTTTNYNGQLTDQVGIHAFWESRIPELFADEEYDYFVGSAEYIVDPATYFWDIVLESHALVDSVLTIEKRLSQTYPSDRQFCFDERLGQTIRIQCREYARAYQDAMDGMVEARWRATIKTIGSSWYTAWIDAGQPDLKDFKESDLSEEEEKALEELNAAFRRGNPKGRRHEGGSPSN